MNLVVAFFIKNRLRFCDDLHIGLAVLESFLLHIIRKKMTLEMSRFAVF